MDFLGMHVTFNKVTISEEKIAALKSYPAAASRFSSSKTFYGICRAHATVYTAIFNDSSTIDEYVKKSR